jgi:type IV secretory pathway TrbD component
MAEQIQSTSDVPPPGEAIHLPGPSYLPVIVATGATIAIVGVVISWWIFGFGLAVTVLAIARWAADTRRDIAELPLEHDASH